MPPLLKNYRNPCWYEKAPGGFSYLDPSTSFYFSYLENKPQKAHNWDIFGIFCPQENLLKEHQGWRLRCFPKFLMIGFPKCGTTDFFFMAYLHPKFAKTIIKESRFWNEYRFNHGKILTVHSSSCYFIYFIHTGL